MKQFDPEIFREDLPAFKEQTALFYKGEVKQAAYKGFSGFYGSYAQKGGKASMLRLRMTAGEVTPQKMAFVADMIRRYDVKRAHFTTCQTIQLHDLSETAVCEIMEEALSNGIITMGGGGDFPRNVMCSPLSGTQKEEYFDVRPWALAAGNYLLGFIKAEKMPRKLKVGFSNSPENIPHATFRDLGFAARKDGNFDVYTAGGLGGNPRFGVLTAEAVEPQKILYYCKAMWLTFRAYGNYENRSKARTRYMQESLGGADAYKEAFLGKLKEVLDSGENLDIEVKTEPVTKAGDGVIEETAFVTAQKQEGLYTVAWHPIGGQPDPKVFCELSDLIGGFEDVRLRLAPDETAYVINLTAEEAEKVLEIIKSNQAGSLFETSVSCIGASICQVGVRDSQELLLSCIEAVRKAGIADGALPQIHISGCPSSCGTHQTGPIGFRGAAKKGQPAFMLFAGGCDRQGGEIMGEEIGTILIDEVPAFLVKLGKAVEASGTDYAAWVKANPEGIKALAQEFVG